MVPCNIKQNSNPNLIEFYVICCVLYLVQKKLKQIFRTIVLISHSYQVIIRGKIHTSDIILLVFVGSLNGLLQLSGTRN